MGLGKRDREFRLPKISYLDFKHLEMDRVLTALFMRLEHNGFLGRLNRRFDLSVESFTEEFLGHPEWFSGFKLHREVLERWIETHFLDVVNRGKPNQAVAAPRPLHGFTYRFRNPKHSRDYGAAQHIYEMLHHARHGIGEQALEHLKSFFFQGHDRITGLPSPQTLRSMWRLRRSCGCWTRLRMLPDTRAGRDSVPPLCVGAADLLAEDIHRLLYLSAWYSPVGDGGVSKDPDQFPSGDLSFKAAQAATRNGQVPGRRSPLHGNNVSHEPAFLR